MIGVKLVTLFLDKTYGKNLLNQAKQTGLFDIYPDVWLKSFFSKFADMGITVNSELVIYKKIPSNRFLFYNRIL